MGLRERLLTAGVALPLVLWFILYDARLCLALALALQAVCIQELGGLLRKTRYDDDERLLKPDIIRTDRVEHQY